MNLVRRFSAVCLGVMLSLAIALCILATLHTSSFETNLAIVVTLLSGFGILYLLLCGMIRRANVLYGGNQELSDRLLSLMDNVPGVVYRGLPDWTVTFAGDEISRLTGYPIKDFLDGRLKWRKVIHPGTSPKTGGSSPSNSP